MMAAGFTASDIVDNNTLFSSARSMSKNECSNESSKYGLQKASEISLNSIELMKILSGNRYKEIQATPTCLNGIFINSVKSCVGISEEASCLNGKYDDINGYTWDNQQGDVITAYSTIYAPFSGTYNLNIETKGRASLYIDGSIMGVASLNGIPYLNNKIYLNEGLHEIKILGEKNIYHANGSLILAGERGFKVNITDEYNSKISNSKNWCKNTLNTTCSTDGGYIKVGNTCLEKTLPVCRTGKLNEDMNACIIEPKCILVKVGEMTYREQKEAVKIEYRYDKQEAFKCSPYKCEDNSCQTATCPSGNPPFKGNIIGAGMTPIKQGECVNDVCDANKPYYEFCGREAGCPQGNPLIFEDSMGNCKEMYCPNGQIFDSKAMKCKKLECPENTVLQGDGSCKRR